MDPLVGAIVAAVAAWASIAAAALLPLRIPARRLRWVGAASIAAVGLAALGVPVPAWGALAILAVGVLGAAVLPTRAVSDAGPR